MNQFIRFPIQIITSGIIEFMLTQHFRVYAILDSHKNRQKQAFPSMETIRKQTKLNRTTTQRAIKDLIEWGLVKKAHIKRQKGRGYRTVYTLTPEPLIKRPLNRIKKKIFSSAKQRRDLKGKFTGQKQPAPRTVLKPSKQPTETAVIPPNLQKESKQPTPRATTNKPLSPAVLNKPLLPPVEKGRQQRNLKQPVASASNQYLTSIDPVKKENLKKESPQPKPFGERKTKKPVDTSESAFTQHLAKLFPKKKN